MLFRRARRTHHTITHIRQRGVVHLKGKIASFGDLSADGLEAVFDDEAEVLRGVGGSVWDCGTGTAVVGEASGWTDPGAGERTEGEVAAVVVGGVWLGLGVVDGGDGGEGVIGLSNELVPRRCWFTRQEKRRERKTERESVHFQSRGRLRDSTWYRDATG